MRSSPWILALALPLCLAASAVSGGEKSGVNDEGFVQRWLVLAPIPLKENEDGASGIAREQIKGEAMLKPKAGEKVKVDGKDLVWKAHTCPDHLLDFNAILNGQTEDSVAYAVTFITAPTDLKDIKMKTGSDDQCKVYHNGKEVLKVAEARAADKDQDTTNVSLRKGVNVMVVKVVNEKIDWSFCVRFTDQNDKPLTNLKATTTE